jgi:hypothetical protein
VQQTNAHEHTGSAEAIRHSLRNGFTAYSELSPVIGFLATVISEKFSSRELDASTEASGPHDFAVRIKRRSSIGASASTASRSASVTLRNAPLCGAGCKSYSVILVSEKQKYFFG